MVANQFHNSFTTSALAFPWKRGLRNAHLQDILLVASPSHVCPSQSDSFANHLSVGSNSPDAYMAKLYRIYMNSHGHLQCSSSHRKKSRKDMKNEQICLHMSGDALFIPHFALHLLRRVDTARGKTIHHPPASKRPSGQISNLKVTISCKDVSKPTYFVTNSFRNIQIWKHPKRSERPAEAARRSGNRNLLRGPLLQVSILW